MVVDTVVLRLQFARQPSRYLISHILRLADQAASMNFVGHARIDAGEVVDGVRHIWRARIGQSKRDLDHSRACGQQNA